MGDVPLTLAALGEIHLGPIGIGLAFASALWGVICMQTFSYWVHFPNDPRHLKILVACLWLLDTTDLALSQQYFYSQAIQNYGNYFSFFVKSRMFSVEYGVSSVLIFVVQVFFISKIWRLWKLLAQGRYVLILLAVIASLALASGLALSILSFLYPTLALGPDNGDKMFPWVQQVGLVVVDLGIMFSLSLSLILRRTGLKRTDSLISTLVLFIVTQGVSTSIFQLLVFLTYVTMPLRLIWIGFRLPGIRIYTNAALASLNWRPFIRSDESEMTSISQPSPMHENLSPRRTRAQYDQDSKVESTAPLSIHVHGMGVNMNEDGDDSVPCTPSTPVYVAA